MPQCNDLGCLGADSARCWWPESSLVQNKYSHILDIGSSSHATPVLLLRVSLTLTDVTTLKKQRERIHIHVAQDWVYLFVDEEGMEAFVNLLTKASRMTELKVLLRPLSYFVTANLAAGSCVRDTVRPVSQNDVESRGHSLLRFISNFPPVRCGRCHGRFVQQTPPRVGSSPRPDLRTPPQRAPADIYLSQHVL